MDSEETNLHYSERLQSPPWGRSSNADADLCAAGGFGSRGWCYNPGAAECRRNHGARLGIDARPVQRPPAPQDSKSP
ncbi:hypothetical protein GCM10010277_84950 [Streptomyces longisporoflavus]|nr:hypothetical protein GCM10010277_84950 [Streptomyces longisporoflavus]